MSDLEFREAIATLPTHEAGQTMAEYGVVLAVITVASVAVFAALGDGVEGALRRVLTLLPV